MSAVALSAAQVLIPAGSEWRYLDDGSNQGTAWREPDFDDAAWPSGPAPLGYGDGDERTVIGYGPDANDKFATTYFRRAFTVTDEGLPDAALLLELVRDDGAIVYLNGREVFRSNMPGGTVTHATRAAATTPNTTENDFVETMLPAGDLAVGGNVIAVEVHQASGTSSDVSFDLRLSEGLGWPGADLTRGPYVQMVTSTSVVLRWRTDAAVDSRARFGESPFALDASNVIATATTEHSVTLSGLTPATRYYYSVGTGTGVLAAGLDYHFSTAPPPGASVPTRVWVLGDSGKANANARNVRNGFLSMAGARSADLVLMLGDNAYENGTDTEMQNAIFDMYPAVLRHAPLWPALGNHDAGGSTSPPASLPHFMNWSLPAAGQGGGEPSGTEKYYSFDYANIHFVCLDSYTSSRGANGAMADWLRRDLSGHARDWVIAYWHHSPYSKGSANSDTDTESVQMRGNLLPILEEHGADLVLSGHSHTYERSYLIDGHYGTSGTFAPAMIKNGGDGREGGDGAYFKLAQERSHQGTVYVVAGTSSQADGSVGNHPAMVYRDTALGSVVLDIDGTRLDARFIDVNGNARDSFTMLKQLPEFVVITRQPRGADVHAGDTVTLQVGAVSAHPLSYQWRRDGQPVPGATNSVWLIAQASAYDSGIYDVLVTDSDSSALSEPARVRVLTAPDMVAPRSPLNLEVVQGGEVVLGVQVTNTATLPVYYRWRRGFVNLVPSAPNGVLELHARTSFIALTNVQPSAGYNSHEISVIISNAAFFPTFLDIHTNAYLTILPDADGDRLPDGWEGGHGLDAGDAADAYLDGDGDGFTNREEYEAGTDPFDDRSFLRIEAIDLNGGVAIEFQAVSNRSYTVQVKDRLAHPVWTRWRDVVPEPVDRRVRMIDEAGSTNRFYRLLTPRLF